MRKKSPEQGKRPAKHAMTVKPLHPRNAHNQGYDFDKLTAVLPKLSQFVRPTPYGNLSIDFADPNAVKTLNAALLKADYHIEAWDIPAGFLCPPIPGRVDYIHYIADLLAHKGKVPKGGRIHALDIGTGANGIYPLLGIQCYGWRFTASDIDPVSLQNVEKICQHNAKIAAKLTLIQQANPKAIFNGIIQADDRFDITLCNPPFHQSLADAMAGSQRKVANLTANRAKRLPQSDIAQHKTQLNFGGQKAELWCEGGEKQFLINMITESALFKHQVLWFSSLVSKAENVKPCYQLLTHLGAQTIETIQMSQGNKQTRVLAWSFLAPPQRELWTKSRP